MSETGRGGINRPFSWIKKVLEITEKTVVPDSQLPDVRATIDVFGWERLQSVTLQTAIGTAVTTIFSTPVPDGVIRVVLAASVEHDDAVVSHTLWIDQEHDFLLIGVQTPRLMIGNTPPVKLGLMRRLVLRPGDRVAGQASPVTGVGIDLTLRTAFVEIPVGEYIPPV